MTWKPPSIDSAHDMYQPGKRAGLSVYRRQQTAKALAMPSVNDPRASGSMADKEAWMRERQRAARVNARMEADLLAEAYQHLAIRRRTRIKEVL